VDSQESSGSTTSPPPAISEDKGLKKRKRPNDLVSSCTSNSKDASGELAAVDNSGFEIFDALDS
jgi:hypothetical protein